MQQAKNFRDLCEYQAYLIRLWRDSDQEPWRASAKQVITGQEFFFVSLEKLFLFLDERTSGEGVGVGDF